jgi:hypothetical protein
MNASWLDWKVGARMLLKYPALTVIGGLSLAAARSHPLAAVLSSTSRILWASAIGV